MKEFRLLITGSRDLPLSGKSVLFSEVAVKLSELFGEGFDQVTIIEGGCATGADRFARELVMTLAKKTDIPFSVKSETHEANWSKNGKSAGPLRNQEMVDTKPDACLAFFYKGAGNKGTTDCYTRALKANIPTKKVEV